MGQVWNLKKKKKKFLKLLFWDIGPKNLGGLSILRYKS